MCVYYGTAPALQEAPPLHAYTCHTHTRCCYDGSSSFRYRKKTGIAPAFPAIPFFVVVLAIRDVAHPTMSTDPDRQVSTRYLRIHSTPRRFFKIRIIQFISYYVSDI